MMTDITLRVGPERDKIYFYDGQCHNYTWHFNGGTPMDLASEGDSVRFTIQSNGELEIPINVLLTKVSSSEFVLELNAPESTTMSAPVEVPGPLVMESHSSEIAFPYYGEGLILKASPPEWDDFQLSLRDLDMPLCILTDGPSACMLWYEIPSCDDGAFAIRTTQCTQGIVPRLHAQMGLFGYRRVLRVTFVSKGGYVAVLKRYRQYLAERGYIVPLRSKEIKIPAVNNLAGAVDLWYNLFKDNRNYPDIIREVHRRGITNAIINQPCDRKMSEMCREFGYVVSRYDCPHYVLPNLSKLINASAENNAMYSQYGDFQSAYGNYGTELSKYMSGYPDQVSLNAMGEQEIVWIQNELTFFDRCSSFYADYSRCEVSATVEQFGLNAIFLDITGAIELKECYHKDHAQNRTHDRLSREACFESCLSQNLMLGTEHGKWWSPRYTCYHEGMMTLQTKCPWQSGYLLRPETGKELTPYDRYGISPVKRVPLYELVFHDCVVDYWYWGDSLDWLHRTRPDVTRIKETMNVLTGTPPLVWLGEISGFDVPGVGWDRFVEAVNTVSVAHQKVAFDEMTDHRWVTEDRLVQCCSFSSGVEAYANFGHEIYRVERPNGPVEIGQYGFAVIGEGFLHHRRGAIE